MRPLVLWLVWFVYNFTKSIWVDEINEGWWWPTQYRTKYGASSLGNNHNVLLAISYMLIPPLFLSLSLDSTRIGKSWSSENCSLIQSKTVTIKSWFYCHTQRCTLKTMWTCQAFMRQLQNSGANVIKSNANDTTQFIY